MPTLNWSDALALDFEPMDCTHREFVALLSEVETATNAQFPAAWSAVIDHTVHHFERENDWMRQSRFAGASDHMLQHRVVLNLLRDGLALARQGELAAAREMAHELAIWFAKHSRSLDAALAKHLQSQAGIRFR